MKTTVLKDQNIHPLKRVLHFEGEGSEPAEADLLRVLNGAYDQGDLAIKIAEIRDQFPELDEKALEEEGEIGHLPYIELPNWVQYPQQEGAKEPGQVALQPILPVEFHFADREEGLKFRDELIQKFSENALYIGLSPLGFCLRIFLLIGQGKRLEYAMAFFKWSLKEGKLPLIPEQKRNRRYYLAPEPGDHVAESINLVKPYDRALPPRSFFYDLDVITQAFIGECYAIEQSPRNSYDRYLRVEASSSEGCDLSM